MHQLMLLVMVLGRMSANEYFDVLRVKEVPFPTSAGYAARLDISYSVDNIPEMTICVRLLIESYNIGATKG